MISRVAIGRRFARIATDVAVRYPRLWRFFRPLVRRQFDALAPVWDSMLLEDTLAPYEAALTALDSVPGRIVDVGTHSELWERNRDYHETLLATVDVDAVASEIEDAEVLS